MRTMTLLPSQDLGSAESYNPECRLLAVIRLLCYECEKLLPQFGTAFDENYAL